MSVPAPSSTTITPLISTVSEPVKLAIFGKFTEKTKDIINNINAILLKVMTDNKAALEEKGAGSAKIEQAKQMATQFFTTYIDNDKLNGLKDLPVRVQKVSTVLVNKSGGEVMKNPSAQLFGMMSKLTSQQNLINFFISQTITPAVLLTEDLEKVYTGEVIDEVLNELK